MGLFALTLRWLDWRVAAAIALAALLFNLFVMPRVGRGIYRDPEMKRDTGIVAYAAMVLVLIVLMRDKFAPVAAAVWAMMAFGDPAATIAGKLLGGPRLPWNPEKTWTGTLANWGRRGCLRFPRVDANRRR
jgi:dolichol kinase